MKKIILFSIIFLASLFSSANAHAIVFNKEAIKDLKEAFLSERCTLIITGNLHTRHSGCKTGIGSCIKIVIQLPPPAAVLEGERVCGTITINPKNPKSVTVDFLYLDNGQMNESYWELEEDLVINDPSLSEEPGGYRSLTLLKGKYEIDRSENRLGRCVVRCKVN
jgi:hypothetical protein